MTENNKDWSTSLIEKSTELLNQFENNIGLPRNIRPGNPEELEKYLSMDANILDKLDMKECANISYRLVQYSLYMQRCLNAEKSTSKMLIKKIDGIIAPVINNYKGAWNMQRAAAIEDNDAAKTLNSALSESEARQERLEFVATGFKNLADHMRNLQFSKKDNNG